MARKRRSGVRSGMTPRAYEQLVATHFQSQGYFTELTPSCNDYGVDVFAEKDGEKLAIQAKMYGGSARKVNRDMVMQLHGAKDYFDCTGAVIVTDGEVADSARKVAAKLRIEVRSLAAADRPATGKTPLPSDEATPQSAGRTDVSFEQIWERFVMPLEGHTLLGSDGRTNKLLSVDWSGVKRLTSSERDQFIPIEVFRGTINHILERRCVTRSEINENYASRASSGVVLILSHVPLFEHLSGPSRLVLRSCTTTQKWAMPPE